jgi:FSR family fosmidomycin resistance protein-like MFS transporter
MGMLFSFPWKSGLWAVLLVCGVVLGKTFGGFLADRFGAARASAVSLLLCAALFLFSDLPILGMLAVLLFNMTMPVTLGVLARIMPGAKGFSFGLLTFALFLGFVPAYLGLAGLGRGIVYAGGAVLSLALLLPVLVKKNG